MSRSCSPLPRPARALTAKGVGTRNALLEAAASVFRELGYYGGSVSEITRRAGLSQGAFYQYFRNKEQLLLELNDRILSAFLRKADALLTSGAPRNKGLVEAALSLVFSHFRTNHYFHRILGEFELIDPVAIGYYEAIARPCRALIREMQETGALRSLDPNIIAYGILGMAYFHAMDWGREEPRWAPAALIRLSMELLRHGVGSGGPRRALPSPGAPVEPETQVAEPATQGERTRQALFRAAETVFGQVGFNRAGIAEITRKAGVAQGTFYVHFKSKRDLLEGFVDHLSREMRWALRQATDRVEDRRDKEAEGIRAFFRFLEGHRRIYRVVAESETLGHDIAMGYYKKLARGYVEGLAQGTARGEIRALPPAFMARSLMGLHHMIGLKWLVWNSSPNARFPERSLDEVVELVLHGLDPARDT